jgi:sulfotransferase family protein
VLDAAEFLKAPETQLRALCAELEVDFTPRMLSWPAGARDTDGVWAPYWYDAVLRSTGFEPYRARERHTLPEHQAILDVVMPAFEALWERRLR